MPIGFLPAAFSATGISISNDEKNLVNYLASLMTAGSIDTIPDYHVSLDVNISFKRTLVAAAATVMVTNDPKALKVTLSEEDIRTRYPWDYEELTSRLKARYIDFKENSKYHDLRKNISTDPQYMKSRYLDPGNTKSSRKDFYNPHIVAQFDKSYTLRK